MLLRWLATWAVVSMAAGAHGGPPVDRVEDGPPATLNHGLSIEPSADGNDQSAPLAAGPSNLAELNPAQTPANEPGVLLRRSSARQPFAKAADTAPWYRTSMGAMAVVLALIAGLYFLLRRLGPRVKGDDGGLVHVLNRTMLGPRQSLVLLSVGQRIVLVGVSSERIDRVCELSDPEEVASLKSRASQKTRSAFSSLLDREAAEFAEDASGGVDSDLTEGRRSRPQSLLDLVQKLHTTKV